VIEQGLCYDQLQISNLAAFETVARRLQDIEAAHIDNPLAPDYELSGDFMGSDERRGGALVAPMLEAHVAGKVAARTAINREKRRAGDGRGDNRWVVDHRNSNAPKETRDLKADPNKKGPKGNPKGGPKGAAKDPG